MPVYFSLHRSVFFLELYIVDNKPNTKKLSAKGQVAILIVFFLWFNLSAFPLFFRRIRKDEFRPGGRLHEEGETPAGGVFHLTGRRHN